MLYLLQQVLNGLHAGALYALLAFGYALTNGVLRRVNLAYGAVFAFCGHVMILAAVFGYDNLWLTLPASIALGVCAAFFYATLLGHALSRHLLQPLAGRSPNTIVAATLGVLLILMELARIAADTHDFWLPPVLAYPVTFAQGEAFKATLTVVQLADCAVVVAVVALAGWGLSASAFGRNWRAVCDDPFAASLCGVDPARVFQEAVVGGALCAALAGVMAGLYFGNIGFGDGLVYGLKILFVTAVGGFLSPVRAALGAAAFGMGEALWAGYFPVQWREAWMYLLLAVMLVLTGANRESGKIV